MPSNDHFATTRWTLVLAAGNRQEPQAERALEELCRIYWYPLYSYVRRHGHSREAAEDLTQAFFARFLEKDYLAGVDREKGRFCAFLLAALKNFLANEWDRASRVKRGGGIPALPLELDWDEAETRYQIEPADQLSPDKLYYRAWAVALLERVVARLQAEKQAEGKAELFEKLRPFLMLGKGAIPYPEVAAELGMNEAAVRQTVHRLRRRYRELLHDEIAQTVADPAQIPEEMQALWSAFAD
jgi:RNA polymerase sigma-70 factor (ECF subfamily)